MDDELIAALLAKREPKRIAPGVRGVSDSPSEREGERRMERVREAYHAGGYLAL